MKPTVLFVHNNSELYGADFVLVQVIMALKEQVRPILAVPSEGPLTRLLKDEGVEVILTRDSVLRRVNFKPLKLPGFAGRLLKDTHNLAKIIRREDAKLVYSNTCTVIAGAWAARLAGVPHLYHLHETITQPRWQARGLARLSLKRSREVIVVSDSVRRYLQKYRRPGDAAIRIIHNGLNPARFDTAGDVEAVRREMGAGPENVLFGVIGRVHPGKGQPYFVEAARLVASVNPRVRFAIVGGTFCGYERLVDELKDQVRRRDLNNRVCILGHRDDIPQVMKALDVLVLPSTTPDSLPTVVLEAMAARRPVIATAQGGCLEMVLHGETGLLAPYDNVNELAQAMLELSHDPGLRRSMGEAGRQRLEESFTLERFHEEIRLCVAKYLPEAMNQQTIEMTQSA
jgi:glycosyltransferase involved in cell wall biosynthesis